MCECPFNVPIDSARDHRFMSRFQSANSMFQLLHASPAFSGVNVWLNVWLPPQREIMIMKKMKHTNIVTLSEVIDDPAGSKLLLVMEYMDGGPVLTREALEKRERLPESLARQYFRDMLKVWIIALGSGG